MRPALLVSLARWTIPAGGALALVLLVVMALAPWSGDDQDAVAPAVVAPAPAGSSSRAVAPTDAGPRPPGRPEVLRIPAVRVRARVVPVGLDASGTLVPPADPRVVGWWSGGARPGGRRGVALLTGHTVHVGGGVFDDLAALEVGDAVEVVTPRGVVGFTVRAVRELTRERLATAAGRLFDQAGAPSLVLVTCTDWDGTRYLGNTVVVARAR